RLRRTSPDPLSQGKSSMEAETYVRRLAHSIRSVANRVIGISVLNTRVQVNPGHPATSFKPIPASHYNVADLTSPQFSSLVLRKGTVEGVRGGAAIGSLEDVPDSQRAMVEKQLKDLNAVG